MMLSDLGQPRFFDFMFSFLPFRRVRWDASETILMPGARPAIYCGA